jgi:large subunit ribosomal protein L25
MSNLVVHPIVTDAPLSVNFLRYRPGHKVRIPITYLNEDGSPGLKRGGYISHMHHELECTVFTDKIPDTLQADVNGLHVGDRIHLEALNVPEGIVPAIPPRSLVAKIAGRRGLIPRAEPVAKVVEEIVEEEVVEEEFDDWNDIF